MLPNLVVIGAMKAGTSSLYQYLRSHPQIFMSEPKEPEYFALDRNWNRGLEWYESLFQDAGNALGVGEASTVYTKYPRHPGIPERMSKLIPQARLIYLVRHPIERIQSHYEHVVAQGRENRSIVQAVLEDPKYVDYSCYALQIEQYLKWFPREQIMVLTSEDLLHKREFTVGRIFDFLGVDASWSPAQIRREYHVRWQSRKLDRMLRSLPGYRRIARTVPPGLKLMYQRIAKRTSRSAEELRPSLPETVRLNLEQRLKDDVARIKNLLPEDSWDWGIGS